MQSSPVVHIGFLGVAVVSWAAGCGGVSSKAAPASTGAAEGGTPFGVSTQPGGGALPDGGTASSAASCPQTPPTLQAGGTVITFQTDPYLGGQPMIYGQPNVLPGGGTLTPLDLRYFLSNVTLVRSDGTPVGVDLVTATGTVEPYGVHFLNAEDAETTAWNIRAPAGSYGGMNVMLGISDACNATDGTFGADTELTWPPPFGYLFLRFEALIDGGEPDGGASSDAGMNGGVGPLNVLPAIAMGGMIGSLFAPTVHIDASLTVPASGPVTRHLRFDMDQVFAGATANVDVSRGAPSGPLLTEDEAVAGERLRRTAPQLPIFVLDP